MSAGLIVSLDAVIHFAYRTAPEQSKLGFCGSKFSLLGCAVQCEELGSPVLEDIGSCLRISDYCIRKTPYGSEVFPASRLGIRGNKCSDSRLQPVCRLLEAIKFRHELNLGILAVFGCLYRT